jgi:cell division septum initiation protein DivIVA
MEMFFDGHVASAAPKSVSPELVLVDSDLRRRMLATEREARATLEEAGKEASGIPAEAEEVRRDLLDETAQHVGLEAEAMVEQAEKEANEITTAAELEARAIVREAEERAREILSDAEVARTRLEQEATRAAEQLLQERATLADFLRDLLAEVKAFGASGDKVLDLAVLRELKQRAGGTK